MDTQKDIEDAHLKNWDPKWIFSFRLLAIQSMMTGMPLATSHPRDLPFSPSGMGESEQKMKRSPELIQKEKNRARTEYVLDTTPGGTFGAIASTVRRYDEMNRLRDRSPGREIFVRDANREWVEDNVHGIVADQSLGVFLQRLGFLPSEFEVDVSINLQGNKVSGGIGVTAGPYSFDINLLDYIVEDESEEDSKMQGFHLINLMNEVEERLDDMVSKWRMGDFSDPQIVEGAKELNDSESKFMELIERNLAKD